MTPLSLSSAEALERLRSGYWRLSADELERLFAAILNGNDPRCAATVFTDPLNTIGRHTTYAEEEQLIAVTCGRT